MLSAIDECKSFVDEWDDSAELLGILNNKLTFVYHEIDNEASVYTVFETLNDRGLDVSWLDKLKSRLMRAAFEDNQGNSEEHVKELHDIWGQIYATLGSLHKVASDIGLRENISSETLRFAATLTENPYSPILLFGDKELVDRSHSQLLGEKKSVDRFMGICRGVLVKQLMFQTGF